MKLGWQQITWQGSTVLSGDFNAHSRQSKSRFTEQWDAVFWKVITEENGLVIGNDNWATQYQKREDLERKWII